MKLFLRFSLILSFLIFLNIQAFSQGKIFDTEFASAAKWDSSQSKSVDPYSNPGELILQTGENENLAKGHLARISWAGTIPTDTAVTNAAKLIDGKTGTYVSILNNARNEGSIIWIDLQATRKINRAVIRTFSENPSLRCRAYSVWASTDSLSYEKVFQETNNLATHSNAYFEPINCRYIAITIDVIDRVYMTVISEIEIYGVGYLSKGSYVSSIRNIGNPVNWGKFSYNAVLPPATQATFQFRSGNSPEVDQTWSEWSDTTSKNNSLVQVDEPRSYLQYKINLETNALETPRVKDITINYDSLLVAKSTKAEIFPKELPVLRQAEISYAVTTSMSDNSLGIDTLLIETPSPAYLQSVEVNSAPVTYQYTPEQKRIAIAFSNTIKSSSTIIAKFKITPYLDRTDFISRIFSKQTPENPQMVEATKNGKIFSWTLQTTDVPPRLLVETKIEPNPFSPNGDGKNDIATISLYLANLNVPRPLNIKIFDITGKIVRNLTNNNTSANAFIEKNAITWDGKNDVGKTVHPGVYLIQINIGSDNGGETITKTITVVY
jgi:hypothetical protein